MDVGWMWPWRVAQRENHLRPGPVRGQDGGTAHAGVILSGQADGDALLRLGVSSHERKRGHGHREGPHERDPYGSHNFTTETSTNLGKRRAARPRRSYPVTWTLSRGFPAQMAGFWHVGLANGSIVAATDGG